MYAHVCGCGCLLYTSQLQLPIGARVERAQALAQELTERWLKKYEGVMRICNYLFVIHTMRQQSKNGLLYSAAVSFNNNSNVPACPMVPKWDPYHSVPEVTGVCQAMQVQLHG